MPQQQIIQKTIEIVDKTPKWFIIIPVIVAVITVVGGIITALIKRKGK